MFIACAISARVTTSVSHSSRMDGMFNVANRASVFACPSSRVSRLSIFGLRIGFLGSGHRRQTRRPLGGQAPTGAPGLAWDALFKGLQPPVKRD
jgi:hypothetical protein